MSKNRQATRDEKKPTASQPKPAGKDAPTEADKASLDMLNTAVAHFAPMIFDKSGDLDEIVTLITSEMPSVKPEDVKQALEVAVKAMVDAAEADKLAADKLAAEEAEAARLAADKLAAEEAEAARLAADKLAEQDGAKVIVNVPKAFRLTLNDGRTIPYPAGAYGMPVKHADHWYSKANGVTVVEQ
jgi:hypothetical protein